ncbi:hypothetical protein VB773_06385 [Haloarculaceae archaeon H-GB2-1]|nr:hypothetical protein [Haloarculaceae archaeon H-GB1-1]MEA5385732.1 hypothetical protein [Haloarculaceae archaeon H-GB11]MEA5407234.1 hypothetical protein [Haloarculaceae archaeon H-GB2-1]
MNWPIHAIHATDGSGANVVGEAGVCPRCGVENDPFYTFCRECTGKLPAVEHV